MEFLKFDVQKCILCGKCVDKCPFGALRIENNGIKVVTAAVCAVFVCVTVRRKRYGLSSGRIWWIKRNGVTF